MSNRYTNQVNSFFTQGGMLDKALKSYRFREGQQQMAIAVADAINAKGSLVVEAGTGIGKSFAYLAPALLIKQKVVISTATKNLQQQLFDKDIPFIANLIDPTLKIAILKGLGNYLCTRNLHNELNIASSLSEFVLSDLLKVQEWSQKTKDGDLNNVNGVNESASSLNLVRTSVGDCTGKKCQYYSSCFSRKAKIRAAESDILVVNHHLVFNESFLQREGDSDNKINADVIVFDEAHSLSDILGQLGGKIISEKLIRSSLSLLLAIYKTELGDSPPFLKSIETFYVSLDSYKKWLKQNHISMITINELLSERTGAACFWSTIDSWNQIVAQAKMLIGRSSKFDALVDEFDELRLKLEMLTEVTDSRFVQYLKFAHDQFEFDSLLHDVRNKLDDYIGSKTATIFTSATLSVNSKLDYFIKPLGLNKSPKLMIESPFDYQRQALLYIPRIMLTDESSSAREDAFLALCEKLINVNQGKTFILCTSHKAVQSVGVMLSRRLRYPVLVQGQSGRQALLKKYRILGDAVLVGTYSFWEGIDLKGRQLSNIIFDKLPFASPDDFFIQSKGEYISHQGGNSFSDLVLPSAVLKLKQGMGRLIRHEKDCGLITIFDERLVSKEYGRYFLDSIPSISRTRDYKKATAFLENI